MSRELVFSWCYLPVTTNCGRSGLPDRLRGGELGSLQRVTTSDDEARLVPVVALPRMRWDGCCRQEVCLLATLLLVDSSGERTDVIGAAGSTFATWKRRRSGERRLDRIFSTGASMLDVSG